MGEIMSIEKQWQAAKNEFKDDAHKRFCMKGWDIERLADTQKRKSAFDHKSLNDYAEWLLNDCISSSKECSCSTVHDENGCFLPEYYPHPYYFHQRPPRLIRVNGVEVPAPLESLDGLNGDL